MMKGNNSNLEKKRKFFFNFKHTTNKIASNDDGTENRTAKKIMKTRDEMHFQRVDKLYLSFSSFALFSSLFFVTFFGFLISIHFTFEYVTLFNRQYLNSC